MHLLNRYQVPFSRDGVLADAYRDQEGRIAYRFDESLPVDASAGSAAG